MSADATIKRAIAELEVERKEIDNKIAALRSALTPRAGSRDARGNGTVSAGRKRSRRKMSAAAKKAVSARMKKYWADRRKAKASK